MAASESRTISLIVYHNNLFAAHWSIFVPSAADPDVGTKIQVTGSLHGGFEHEFVRGYRLSEADGSKSLIALGAVDATNIVDPTTTGSDVAATDVLEDIALTVPAPGKSLRSAADRASMKAITLKDCQYWAKEYVGALVARNVCSQDAVDIIAGAPAH